MPHRRSPAPAFQTGFGNPPVPADVGYPVGDLPPQFPAGQQAPGSVVITFPWWERPTVSSLDYNPVVQGVALPGVVGASVDLCFVDVKQSYVCVLRGVNIFATNTTPAFNVDYVVLWQGSPLLQQPLKTFGRTANSIEVPFSFAKRVTGPGKLLVRAVNRSANAWTVGASITGWTTPSIDAARAEG